MAELKDFVEKNNIHIILVQETHTSRTTDIKIKNYNLYHTPRDNPSYVNAFGGTAIYVKSHIPHSHTPCLPTRTIEHTQIKLNTPHFQNLNIVSAYAIHKNNFITSDLNLFLNGSPTIIAGDLNAKHPIWSSGPANLKGTLVNNFLTNNINTHVAFPDDPTYHSLLGIPATLDIALFFNCMFNYEIQTLKILNSDHYPVLLKLFTSHPLPADPFLSSINWLSFKNYLRSPNLLYHNINSPKEIDNCISKLTNEINRAKASATTYFPKDNSHYLLPSHIQYHINKRNRLRRQWQATRDPNLKTLYNRKSYQVKMLIRDHKNKNWGDYLESVTTDDNSVWKVSNYFRRKKKASDIPVLRSANSIAVSIDEKVNLLASNYELQFKPNPIFSASKSNIVNTCVNNFLNTPPTHIIPPTHPLEIIGIINSLPRRKSPGDDNINNNVLKHLPLNVIFLLTLIINAILKFKYFPRAWKNAIIVPIPKPGEDLTDPSNYRPISLLPSISKVAERIIHNRLASHIYDNNIIIPEQFGFRPMHGTTHQLLRVAEIILDGIRNKKSTGMVLIDIAKAFDKVWHNGLIYKIIQHQVPDALIHLIHSYLSDRTFQVRLHNTLSTHRHIYSGVPQGSILSPSLFSLFVNDIPKNPHTHLALYADDTAILCTDANHNNITTFLQDHLNSLQNWFIDWKIKVNPSKSNVILFSQKRNLSAINVSLNSIPIPSTNSAKYLGVIFDTRLTWNLHIKSIIEKFTSARLSLSPLIFSKKFSVSNKILLYKSFLRPIILYAAPVWGCAANTHINKLQILQNKYLRHIRHAPRFLRNSVIHHDFKINTVRKQIQKHSSKFYNNISAIPTTAFDCVNTYNPLLRKNRKRPRATLFLT